MEDDDLIECQKFEDCRSCKWRFSIELFCEDDCDVGESYEPEDIEEVDAHFVGRL